MRNNQRRQTDQLGLRETVEGAPHHDNDDDKDEDIKKTDNEDEDIKR